MNNKNRMHRGVQQALYKYLPGSWVDFIQSGGGISYAVHVDYWNSVQLTNINSKRLLRIINQQVREFRESSQLGGNATVNFSSIINEENYYVLTPKISDQAPAIVTSVKPWVFVCTKCGHVRQYYSYDEFKRNEHKPCSQCRGHMTQLKMIRFCKCGYADGIFVPKCPTEGHGTKYMTRRGSGIDFVCGKCGKKAPMPFYCKECNQKLEIKPALDSSHYLPFTLSLIDLLDKRKDVFLDAESDNRGEKIVIAQYLGLVSQESYTDIIEKGKLTQNEELWIFSLNHDLLIEMLCIDNKIPLKLGYNEKIQIPNRNENNDKFLEFGVIDATIEDINLLDYYKSQKGINLLKIHGGLNEFFQGDEKSGRKRVFFMPEKYERSRDYLNDIINFWHDTHYSINGRTVPVEGEICVSDNAGELQFFQPTILTGSKKYTKTLKTQKREEKIALFSSGLKNIDELYIVGYGFGDEHINNRIVNAMHLNEKMKLTIIDPSGAKHKILEPFDYDLRVCYANMDFSVWSDYIKTGQWDPEIRKHLDTSTVPLRKRIIESIKNNIVPK